ncbi:MAG: hypothetical protein R2792_03340 [Saprospiraceae bacterium]
MITRKTQTLLTLVLLVLFTSYCKQAQKTAETPTPPVPPEELVSYAADIKPIMDASCTPCHYPEKGRKKMLDTYAATKDNAGEILKRVQLPADDIEFMPFKSKKTPLTEEQIALFKKWARQGMPE